MDINIMNEEEMMKSCFFNLKKNEFMMVSGGSLIGIDKIIRQAISDALDSGKRVALFQTEGDDETLLIPEEIKKTLKNGDLLSMFHSASFRIDDIEISNGYSLSDIVQEVESKENTDEKYDLVIITNVGELSKFAAIRSLGMIAEKIGEVQKRFSVPVIVSHLFVKNQYRGLSFVSEKERLFHSARSFVDFLIEVNDDGTKEKHPLEFNVRLYKCKNTVIDTSFFFNKDDNMFYLKDENTSTLFNKALGLGLDKDDAIVYATYWNKKESAGYKNDDN